MFGLIHSIFSLVGSVISGVFHIVTSTISTVFGILGSALSLIFSGLSFALVAGLVLLFIHRRSQGRKGPQVVELEDDEDEDEDEDFVSFYSQQKR